MTSKTSVVQKNNLSPREKRFIVARRFFSNNMLLSGSIIIAIMTILALFAPLIAPFNPYEINTIQRLESPSATHWFGTDNFGRDLLSRVLYGTRVSFIVGCSVAVLASVIGLVIGIVSAYNTILDHVLMRIVDGLYAFPSILLAMAIVAVMGPKTINVVLALTVVYIPSIARVVRSAALVVKEQTFIEALRAQGASNFRIMVIHMFPNVISPLIVQSTFIFAVSILTEAALSFLGAGIPAPAPSLGNILYDGKSVIYNSWWMTVFPGVFVVALVLGLNLLGDGLRDFLDPKTRGMIKRKRLFKRGGVNG